MDRIVRLPVKQMKMGDGQMGTLYVREDGRYEGVTEGRVVEVDGRKAAKEHLEVLIQASGLTRERFAVEQVARNESTLRRWTAGKVPIPRTVIQWMFKQSLALAAGRDVVELETLDQMLGLARETQRGGGVQEPTPPEASGGGRREK